MITGSSTVHHTKAIRGSDVGKGSEDEKAKGFPTSSRSSSEHDVKQESSEVLDQVPGESDQDHSRKQCTTWGNESGMVL